MVEILRPVADVGPLLHDADFHVSTSLSEGMSNALLESMSWGTPADRLARQRRRRHRASTARRVSCSSRVTSDGYVAALRGGDEHDRWRVAGDE